MRSLVVSFSSSRPHIRDNALEMGMLGIVADNHMLLFSGFGEAFRKNTNQDKRLCYASAERCGKSYKPYESSKKMERGILKFGSPCRFRATSVVGWSLGHADTSHEVLLWTTKQCRRRALAALSVIQRDFPKQCFHISNAFPEIISWIVRSLFCQHAYFSNDVGISFVIWEPPVIYFGYLPMRCHSGSISRSGKVSVQYEELSMSISLS